MIPEGTRYYVIDSETTSADPDRGVVEVGWVEIGQDFNILGEVESIIDPQKLIHPAASGVHGLVNKDCENSPTLEEYFSADDPSCFGKPIPGPAVVIGHRVAFDTHTMGPHIDRLVAEVCTLRMVRRVYPHMDDFKLQTLIFALNLPRAKDAHRVLSDVYSALALTKHLCERMGCTLKEFAEASQVPFELPIMIMGKHKGLPMNQVPRSWLGWALSNMTDLDPDLRYTFRRHLNN